MQLLTTSIAMIDPLRSCCPSLRSGLLRVLERFRYSLKTVQRLLVSSYVTSLFSYICYALERVA
jgi:hypothetical protein